MGEEVFDSCGLAVDEVADFLIDFSYRFLGVLGSIAGLFGLEKRGLTFIIQSDGSQQVAYTLLTMKIQHNMGYFHGI